MNPSPATSSVDPIRLRFGTWCHRSGKTIGEGDIAASYSADRIAMGQPIRQPFVWYGASYVCIGLGFESAEAYRLMHPEAFSGEPVTYRARTMSGDAARRDPNGFYHGIVVRHSGNTLVLCGPPTLLVAGQPEQMDLFD